MLSPSGVGSAAAAATTMPPSPIASGAATDAAPVGNIVAMIRAVESFNVNGAAC